MVNVSKRLYQDLKKSVLQQNMKEHQSKCSIRLSSDTFPTSPEFSYIENLNPQQSIYVQQGVSNFNRYDIGESKYCVIKRSLIPWFTILMGIPVWQTAKCCVLLGSFLAMFIAESGVAEVYIFAILSFPFQCNHVVHVRSGHYMLT